MDAAGVVEVFDPGGDPGVDLFELVSETRVVEQELTGEFLEERALLSFACRAHGTRSGAYPVRWLKKMGERKAQ